MAARRRPRHTSEAMGRGYRLGPHGPWNDLQECQRTADRLFGEGRNEDWVEYSTAVVVPGEVLGKAE